ncbi:MAG: nucleotide pyrophosphatase, partial [Candidatus Krumholzibacteria bacterium]|nr:nucleotide pyrophosphatase [Candidatus Krumholzibacteria bacterium]
MSRPLTIVLLIDALGWEIAERFEFCKGLSLRRAPLGTVLGYSSAAIPSLLSGALPSEHGAWA